MTSATGMTAEVLAGLFADCASSEVNKIQTAERLLVQATQNPLFVTASLQLIALRNGVIPTTVRQMAAIYMKNHVKKHWDIPEKSGGMQDTDRALIKVQIVDLAIQTTSERSIYTQLASTIQLIAAVDFPSDWTTLLPTLCQRCLPSSSQADMLASCAAFELIDDVLQRYRRESRSNEILHELKFEVLPHVQEMVVKQFTQLVESLLRSSSSAPLAGSSQAPVTPEMQEITLKQAYFCCRILLSLISIDLPEYIEDHKDELYKSLILLLSYQNPRFSGASLGTGLPGVLENAKTEVCRFVTTFALRYCEEFEPFCITATSAIMDVLVATASEPAQPTYLDDLVSAAMLYLGAVARYKWTPCPFSDPPSRLNDICQYLIIPNLQLRDQDIALMEDNAQEFVRRNLEGSDSDTRRGAAVELVHALMQCFDTQISAILPRYVAQLLAAAKETPPQSLQCQRLKDAAVYLVIALVVKAQSRAFGVSEVRESVNIAEFFAHIVDELVVPPGAKTVPNVLIRCSTLKFVATVRNQLDKSTLLQLLPEIARNLTLPDPVVHTHAAFCLENILMAREIPKQQTDGFKTAVGGISDRGCLKFSPEDVQAVLLPSLNLLLQMIKSGTGIPDNEYLMRCVMKIINFLQHTVTSVVFPTLEALRDLLRSQCDCTSNPIFVHFLFESIALCTKLASKSGRHAEAEQILLETLSTIITQPDHDFTPYALQMMGLLVDTAVVASPLYVQLLDHLLEPNQWAISVARVPGIVRVLSALFRKQEVFKTCLQQRLETMMLRFQYCLNHKRLCSVAFDLLDDMLCYLPVDFFTPFLQPLVVTLLKRLQAAKTPKLSQHIVFSLSVLTCRSDAVFLPSVLNTIQPNLAVDFLLNVFLPTCKTPESLYKKKVSLLATAKMCTAPEVLNNPQLLALAVDVCASLMGVVSQNDVARTKPTVTENGLAAPDTCFYDKPFQPSQDPQEFQGSFNVLLAAKVAHSAKEIPEVSSEALLANVRRCLDNKTLATRAQAVPAWNQMVALLATAS